MIERIERVINNHQLSCHHTSKYFYILRGFKPIIDNITIPVAPFKKEMRPELNRYILEEDLDSSSKNDFEGFEVWSITFNFFVDKLLDENANLVSQTPIKGFEEIKNISIFNENNPLIGVLDTLDLSDESKIEYLKFIHVL